MNDTPFPQMVIYIHKRNEQEIETSKTNKDQEIETLSKFSSHSHIQK